MVPGCSGRLAAPQLFSGPMPISDSPRLPITAAAALLVNAAIWGISWLPFRYLDAHGLHSLWSTAWIYLVASVIFLFSAPGMLSTVLRSRWLLLLGLASGLTNACFNWGVTIGEVMRVVLLFFLMPVWAVLIARLLVGERIDAPALFRVALAVIGATTVLWSAETGLPTPNSLADWLGLFGGMGFALTSVLLRREAATPARAKILAMALGSVLVPMIAALLATSNPSYAHLVAWPDINVTTAAAATATALLLITANLLLQYGAALLPANVTAVIAVSEVAFAALSSWWIAGEAMTARTLVGGAMIIFASALASVSARRREPSD
jgi:drug/metabolite transporter (DMT)-like permease